MNVGSDIGNVTAIAIGEEDIIIESIVEEYEQEDKLISKNVFSFDEKLYTLNKGDFENNLLKYKKTNFMKLLFYTLYKCTDDCINNVVIGIPAKQYKSEIRVKEFYETLEKNRIHTINDKTIILNKIRIIPEGYGLKALGYLDDYEQHEELLEGVPTLVIDIGGETTDLILFDENHNFVKAENIKHGLLKIYEDARTYLNDTYVMNISKADAKKYFDGDRKLRKTSNIEDPDAYKQDIIIVALKKILNEIKNYFENIEQYNILLCGGGAEIVGDTFKDIYSQTIVINDIDVNAQGYKVLADMFWEDENDEIELTDEVKDLLDEIWENRHEEENKNKLINIWNNKQGKKILEDLYNIEDIGQVKDFNIKEYLKNYYSGK